MQLSETHLSEAQSFYDALAESLEKNHIPFIWSNFEQPHVHLKKTIFIPFEKDSKEDTDGYGLYLFLSEIKNRNNTSYCIIASTILQLVNPSRTKEIGLLLHEINLNLAVPGWILNEADNTLIFKYLFPFHENKRVPSSYLTLIVAILNEIGGSFPLIKEVSEGKQHDQLHDQIAKAFS